MRKLDKLVKHFYAAINTALDKACPLVHTNPVAKSHQWITKSHLTEKDRVSLLYKQAKKEKTTKAWAEYKAADKSFKQRCKRDRNKSWRVYKELSLIHI